MLVYAFAPRPVDVETATVTRGAFRKTVDEDGRTRVRDRYVVSAPVPGRLLRVDLKAGAPIARDALLARLVPAPPAPLDARTEQEYRERAGGAEASQLRAKANLERADVALAQAKADEARAAQLASQGFASRQALDNAQREVELRTKELAAARFDEDAAVHQLAMARAALARYRQDAGGKAGGDVWEIRSPVAGTVLRVIQESEAPVSAGAPHRRDRRPARARDRRRRADGGRRRASRLARRSSSITGAARPLATGRVRLVEPSAFTKVSALGVEEQRVNVVIDFAEPPSAWGNVGDGHRVDARIGIETRADALLVPNGALFRQGDRWAVFVVETGRARARPVELGPRNGLVGVVLQGLAASEQVIVYPSDAVRDGVRISVRARPQRP